MEEKPGVADKVLDLLVGNAVARVGRLTAEQTSRYFAENNRIEWDQVVCDGFYDPGNGREFKPLSEYTGVVTEEDMQHGRREVLLIDEKNDARLRRLVVLAEEMRKKNILSPQMFKNLAGSAFGGFTEDRDERSTKGVIGKPIVQRLLDIEYGVCRHSSLLIKYLADKVGVPAWMQRGYEDNEKHTWVIFFLNGELQKVDMMDGRVLDTRWPNSSYVPSEVPYPKEFTTRYSYEAGEVDGYWELPEWMTRVATTWGGVETRVELPRYLLDTAGSVMVNMRRYEEVARIAAVHDTYMVIDNVVTVLGSWLSMALDESEINIISLLKALTRALICIHAMDYTHGAVSLSSVAVSCMSGNPYQISTYKLIFPCPPRAAGRSNGPCTPGDPSKDWEDLKATFLNFQSMGADNLVVTYQVPAEEVVGVQQTILAHFEAAIKGDPEPLNEYLWTFPDS